MTPSVTFTWTPSYTYDVTPNYDVRISKYESGKEERVLLGTVKREWNLRFHAINKTNRDAIETFFKARSGTLSAFYWACLDDSTTYTVRFVDDGLRVTRIEASLYDIDCSFVECDA